jgi:hypothetical protein
MAKRKKNKNPSEEESKGSGLSRRDFIKIASVAAGAAAVSGALPRDILAAGGPKPPLSTPTINCDGATQASINIKVCAGQTGAPAGFSIQWMTCDDFAANGSTWPDSDCVPGVECPASFCAASFSGNANLSRYNLAPNECVTVNLGEFLFDEGASTSCTDALLCGTCYEFRAFAHGNSNFNRSAFTHDQECATLECESVGQCTFTQGYWKTHGPGLCVTGNNTNEWPNLTGQCCTGGNGLCLGNVCYSDDQLCAIFNATGTMGNGLPALAHQLIAAKLNILNGADGADAAQCIAAADALIGNKVVGTDFISSSDTSGLTTCLTKYNEGATGPGHCEE